MSAVLNSCTSAASSLLLSSAEQEQMLYQTFRSKHVLAEDIRVIKSKDFALIGQSQVVF